LGDGPGSDSIDVFTFLDFRAFLQAAYAARKARGLSHRWLARRSGIRSPSFLLNAIQGKRNLAPSTAARVARALGLDGDAANYLVALVAFNQARDPAGRDAAYRLLKKFRRFRDVQALDLASDAYHSHWYIPVVRELAATATFHEDAEWISRVLRPRISIREARHALATLEKLGLLERDAAGSLRSTHREVTTELETRSVQIASFHRAMMQRASEAIDDIPRAERDVSSITLGVNAQGLTALKRRIQELRRELIEEFGADRSAVQIVQVNFQLFPLTRNFEEEK